MGTGIIITYTIVLSIVTLISIMAIIALASKKNDNHDKREIVIEARIEGTKRVLRDLIEMEKTAERICTSMEERFERIRQEIDKTNSKITGR